eukprot:393977-Hanusia_phi.AAC.1
MTGGREGQDSRRRTVEDGRRVAGQGDDGEEGRRRTREQQDRARGGRGGQEEGSAPRGPTRGLARDAHPDSRELIKCV